MDFCFPLEESVFSGKYVKLLARRHGVFELLMARPQVRNAFHADMILEIRECLSSLTARGLSVRLLLLTGEGPVFSAGADLDDMRSSAHLSFEGNLERARGLARLFFDVASFPAPVVAVVKGAAIGGAMGLVSCADVTIASAEAVFATPECRLGIVAATIGPFLVRRVGHTNACHILFLGRRFSAQEAQRMGLVQEIVSASSEQEFELRVADHLRDVLAGGPEAARRTKALLTTLSPLPDPALVEYTARCLAEARSSAEGQAGVSSFFAREAPPWARDLVSFRDRGAGKA